MLQPKTVLEVRRLSVAFRMYDRGLEQKDLKVINDLSIKVREGEILAVAGSSGSGKSLLAHAVLGILPSNATAREEMFYCGQELTSELKNKLRGKGMALVPQSVEYLDPLMRVGKQVIGAGNKKDRHEKQEKQRAIFEKFHLSRDVEKLFPYQLSGGMARRALITTAVIGDAKLIIADEPTPGLGKGLAQRAMRHFRELADEGRAVLIITHDISLAIEYADRIAVFYAGTTLETANAGDFRAGESALRHPYTKALWRAMPQNGFEPIEGLQPYSGSHIQGCVFASRCPFRDAACSGEIETREIRGGEARCVHAT